MASTGQYQGSQAFNHINPLMKESVNPNTGSLNFSLPLVKLKGLRDSIDVTVNLFYSAGFRGTFGLPRNWGLDLPYVLYGKSLTTEGRTYSIDSEWTDVKGHASGLRYTNNHGIKFQTCSPPESLPSGQGDYGYKLKHVDGSLDYFDVLGKPVEHYDIYGNLIRYSYVGGEQEGVDSAQIRIGHIQDSWGQEITFNYEEGVSMRIILPDGSETLIEFSENGVYAITDAAKNKTNIEYAPFNDGPEILSSISFPSGLISSYTYASVETIAYLNDKGKVGYLPAVENHRALDSESNIYEHTRYIYGSISGQTYTGAAIGCKMGGSSDSLMDDNERALDYEYDVITLSLDRDEKPIARACTWYNNLHLPKRETRYLLNGQGGFIEASETRLTYNADREKRARITSYNIPVRTEAFCNTSSNGEPTWLALNYTEAKYNDYGNPVESTTWVNVKDTGYTKQGSTKTEYLTTQAEVQFPAKVWNRDEVSGMLEYKEHKPSPDGKSVESAVTWYQDSLEPRKQLQPWKETICKYDSFGRAVSNTVAWSSGANVPDGAVRSFTTRTEYSKFDKGLLSRTEIDALGKPTVLQQDMRLSTSPIIRKTLPLGQTETFEFDPIGRILKHVNAQGQFTTTAHIPGPAGTSTIVTSPLGYRTKTSFDVLGREFEVSDNGDPTVTLNDQASRNLGHKRYDTRGSVEDSTNRLGLTTRASYDALNRPLTSTDVHGNVVSYKYDNGGLKVTQAINDDTRKITDLDGLFRPVLEVDYPDSSDQSTDFCIVSEYIYTSDGKVSHKTVSQQSKSSTANESRTRLIDEETKYGPGQIVQSEISRGYTEDGCETVARRYIHDLFGNKTTYTKQTSYADGRAFTHQGPTKFFNENNQLVTYRNQEGKEEHHSFDDNGWLKKKVRFDGSGVSYSCNDLGQVSKVVYPSSTTENTWDADGRLIQTREGANAINYSISLDDTSTGLKYSDGRAQSTVLDKFSRPVKEINVFGVVKETEYNSVGSVTRRSCQSETVTYAYGTTNHARGQHVGSKFSGKRNYQTDHAYDGFNRLRQTIVRDSDSSVVLETTYQVDAKEKIRSVTSKSAVFSEHNFKRDFSYDGIGQLLQETRTSPNPSTTKYSYDGNSNVSSIDIEGHTIHMAYNKIDQRTDEGFKYDTNGRLLQDNEGRRFSFDERDRLLSVSEPSHSDTKYIYRPDDRLAQRSQGDTDSATFYYDTTKINAIHTTSKDGHHQDAKTSLFSDSDSILAGFTDGEYLGHALKQMGSTAVVVGPDSHVSSLYSAYGTQNSSPVESLLSSFGFSQAFTDQVHGLIYLSSRFYNPKQMSFLSMDTYETENRYTYCEGDPINRIDPTGHSWVDWLATGVGIGVAIGVGAAVTALTAGTSAPLMAAILGGILGGTLGNVSSLAVTQLVGGRDVTAGEYLAAGIMGGIVGGLSAGVGYTMTQAAGASVLKAMSGGAFTGGLTAGVSESLNMLNKGEEFSFSRLALSVASGAAKGAISGYWARRTFLRNQMYESAAPGRTWSRTATIGANDGPRSESGMDAIEIIQKVTASNGVVYEILRLY